MRAAVKRTASIHDCEDTFKLNHVHGGLVLVNTNFILQELALGM